MNKKRKYAYAAMTSACLVIAVVVVLNIVAGVLAKKMNLNIDMTSSGILDFDKKTEEIVENLNTDVEIISLIPDTDETEEIKQIDEILKKYDVMSERINYKRVDTKKNPAYLASYKYDGLPLNEYGQAANYHIIFETERASEVVSINDVIPISSETKKVQYLLAEQNFTSAILKVEKGSDINVYVTTGHGEVGAEVLKNTLPGKSYNFKDISLLNENIPDDADLIAIVSPDSDFSESEVNKIALFMDKGGDVQLFVDPEFGASSSAIVPFEDKYPNFSRFLGEWGVEVKDGFVYDGDSKHTWDGSSNIIATIPENELTSLLLSNQSFKEDGIKIPGARPVAANSKNDVYAYTFASTSSEGFIKYTPTPANDLFDKNADTKAVSDLAVMAAKTNYGDTSPSRLFVFGASSFISMNPKLYGHIINYMTDSENTVYIAGKDIAQSNVTVKQSTVYIYTFVVCAVIPIIILAAGFIIWIRRRHL